VSYVVVPLRESSALSLFYYKKLRQHYDVIHGTGCCYTNEILVNSANIKNCYSVVGIITISFLFKQQWFLQLFS